MELFKVLLQTLCRALEIALTGVVLSYYWQREYTEKFWISGGCVVFGQVLVTAASVFLLKNAARSLSLGRCSASGFAAAHALQFGDGWWFFKFVVAADTGDDEYHSEYGLARLTQSFACSAPLLLVSCSTYVQTFDAEPGLCVLSSLVSIVVTWSFYPDYSAALTRKHGWLLRTVAIGAKTFSMISRFSVLSRVFNSSIKLWIILVLAVQFSLLVLWLQARETAQRGTVKSWVTLLIKAAAHCLDLLLQPGDYTLSLIAAYYSLMLLENCVLVLAWYSVDSGVTGNAVLWLVSDFASFTLGLIMTIVHYMLAKNNEGPNEKPHHENVRKRIDALPIDDYEWDPYDGDIQRRISYTNVAFELESRPGQIQSPPLAIVNPYSGLLEKVLPFFLREAVSGSTIESSETKSNSSAGDITVSKASKRSDASHEDISHLCELSAVNRLVTASRSLDRCESLRAPSGSGTEPTKDMENVGTLISHTTARPEIWSSLERGWDIRKNMTYTNCGFVNDDGVQPRYLPHAPRGVFTARWHSGSRYLSNGGIGGVGNDSNMSDKENENTSELLPSSRSLCHSWALQNTGPRDAGKGSELLVRNTGLCVTADRGHQISSDMLSDSQPVPSDSGSPAYTESFPTDTRDESDAPALGLSRHDGSKRTIASPSQQHWVRRWLHEVIRPSQTTTNKLTKPAVTRYPDTNF